MYARPVFEQGRPELSEEDILLGMEALQGYVDLTPQDLRELYARIRVLAHERLLRERRAEGIMTTPVFSISQDSSIGECISLLAEKAVSGAPVVDAGASIVGVISEKDILRLLGRQPEIHLMRLIDESARRPLQIAPELLRGRVATAMSAPAVTAGPASSLGELAHIFERRAINRLPIVDASGAVLGIITRANIIHAVSELT